MKIENDLGNDRISGLVWKIAIPSMLAQFVSVCYSIVDRIYVGNIPEVGDVSLAGVGICGPVVTMIGSVAFLVGVGGAPMMSIQMGAGRDWKARRILANAFLMLAVLSVLLVAAVLPIREPMLRLFGASGVTYAYAETYFTIYLCGTIFALMSTGMNQYIICQGFAVEGMKSVILGAVCNIVLDPVFIFVFDMGVPGAALATILSQAVSCIWVLAFLFGKKTVLRIRRENLRLSAPVILPCVALGLATFIMQTSESILSVCFNSSLLKYGGDIAVGAMTILSSVMQFAMLPLQGLGQGAQPIISYNYGAGNGKRVKDAFFLLLKCSVIYSLLLWLSVELAPHLFAGIFTSNPELVEFSSGALRIYMAGMFLFGVQMACQMTFNSLGNAKASIAVAVVRKFVLLIPLIYAMPLLFSSSPEAQTRAIYMAEPIADILAVTFTAILFYFQFRKALRPFAQKKNVIQ